MHAAYGEPQNIAFGADRSVIVADTYSGRIRTISLESGLRRISGTYVPSSDGSVLHQFDEEGRHLRTIDALTRVALFEFSYDEQKRVRLVTDADGRQTELAYGDKQVTITSPSGDVTTLELTADGYLSSATSRLGTYRVMHRADGLLTRFENPRQFASTFEWQPDGRLRRDSDAAGGFHELSRVDEGPDAWTVTAVTAEGRTTVYERDRTLTTDTRLVTNPSGLSTLLSRSASEAVTLTTPDGTTSTDVFAPDFRFGMTAPLLQSSTVRLPSGTTRQVTQSRSLQLGTADLLFVNSLTDTVRINNRAWTSAWTFADRKLRVVSPAGRVFEQILDGAGRLSEVRAPGVLPVTYTYDPLGRPETVSQGTRTLQLVWDVKDQLVSLTDPANRSVGFTYDAAGRVRTQTLPGQRTIEYDYDANGNVRSVTPPSRPAHDFAFTPVDLVSSYAAPAASDGKRPETAYRYDRDRGILDLVRPSGETISFAYDGGGRVSSVTSSSRNLAIGYDAAGRLASLSGDGGPSVTYGWDGMLPVSSTWAGEVAGTVSWSYDPDFRPSGETVNGSTVSFLYDADSLLRSAGALQLQLDAASGRLSSTSIGNVTDSWSYDEYGAVSGYSAAYAGAEVFRKAYTRDALGRIATETETSFGLETTRIFGYDVAGRLETVTRNGAVERSWTYDANGNRQTAATPSESVSATYDDQDRLLTYGDLAYSYTTDGDLLTRTGPEGTTSYTYDSFGNLREVELPDGRRVEYLIDGQNRRVGKKVDGTLVRAWLYADQLRIVAELDGTGAMISRFVYGSRTNVPDYMIRDGVTYRIVSDHLGSPRMVIDVATGAIAQAMGYGEFGEMLADTNPGFQPFGFAGGLWDRDTRLMRFGARDYDPSVGRWVAKDPALFNGGWNLYGYAYNDPVNLIDPDGRNPLAGAFAAAGVASLADGPLPVGEIVGAGIIAVALWQHYINRPPAPIPVPVIDPVSESRNTPQIGRGCPRPNEQYHNPRSDPPTPGDPNDPKQPPTTPPLVPSPKAKGWLELIEDVLDKIF